MALLRIRRVEPLTGHRLRLTLSNGTVIERDVAKYLVGPVFEAVRSDPHVFAQVRVDHGTVVWPGDLDLCPDVLIDDEPPTAPRRIRRLKSQHPPRGDGKKSRE
jgi:hypothetical protein